MSSFIYLEQINQSIKSRFKKGRINLESANLLSGFAKKNGEEKVKKDKVFDALFPFKIVYIGPPTVKLIVRITNKSCKV